LVRGHGRPPWGQRSQWAVGHVVAEGHVQFHCERFRELYRLDAVDDDVLEVTCAAQRRQIIAAQIASPIAAPAEVGQA
jgi:hypothetical protein